MNTKVLTVLSAEEMLKEMLDVLEKVDRDFSHIREEYEQSMVFLHREIGEERVARFLSAVNRRCEADLLFCGSLGYQANLNNFRDPIARTFMEVDFEDYLRVNVLQTMPARYLAEKEIDEFYHSLDDVQKGAYEAVSSYLVSLELDLTKLAHYAGFMFANEMLAFTEPGYSPNIVLTLQYRAFMEKWFGEGFAVLIQEDCLK